MHAGTQRAIWSRAASHKSVGGRTRRAVGSLRIAGWLPSRGAPQKGSQSDLQSRCIAVQPAPLHKLRHSRHARTKEDVDALFQPLPLLQFRTTLRRAKMRQANVLARVHHQAVPGGELLAANGTRRSSSHLGPCRWPVPLALRVSSTRRITATQHQMGCLELNR